MLQTNRMQHNIIWENLELKKDIRKKRFLKWVISR